MRRKRLAFIGLRFFFASCQLSNHIIHLCQINKFYSTFLSSDVKQKPK